MIRYGLLCCLAGLSPLWVLGQPTTGELRGKVIWDDGAIANGVTVTLTHKPSGTRYTTLTNQRGLYLFSGLHPGYGYTLEASHIQGRMAPLEPIRIGLGEVSEAALILQVNQVNRLSPVIVYARQKKREQGDGPFDFKATGEEMTRFASASRQMHESLRILPEVTINANGQGSVSVAGQNYRYNAVYTDGMVSHDIFGIAASGTYGGLSGISPVSMEAIEVCKLVTTPTDAMQGHFTGAALHTITKRGSNRASTTGYHYFQHPSFTGRTASESRAGWRPDDFYVSTSGISTQGAFKKNRLFYFFNVEEQQRQIPYFNNTDNYQGEAIKSNLLPIIRNQLISEYGYDPGSYDAAKETAVGQKMLLRIDAILKKNQQLIFTGRYLSTSLQKPGFGHTDEIHFSNNGYQFDAESYHLSVEWRKIKENNRSAQWLLQMTQSDEVRGAIGTPFPRVKITDGLGSIWLGTDPNSVVNRTQQWLGIIRKQNQWMIDRHTIHAGIEAMYGAFSHLFIPYSLGYYIFDEPADFIKKRAPVYYRIHYGWNGTTANNQLYQPLAIGTWDLSTYASIRMQLSDRVTLWVGGRLQKTFFNRAVEENDFVNRQLIPLFTAYRTFNTAPTGVPPEVHWSFGPKAAIEWKWRNGWAWQTALAWQAGRLPLVWPASLYANNGDRLRGFVAGGSRLEAYRLLPGYADFRRVATETLIDNNIPLYLMEEKMRLPAQIRLHTKLIFRDEQKSFFAEWLYTQNRREPAFTQLNLLPTERNTPEPGKRKVYEPGGNAAITLPGGISHPYTHSILLSTRNSSGAGSTLWKVGGQIRLTQHVQLEGAYAYNVSRSYIDATGSIFSSLWQQTTAAQGKNDPELSPSDFGVREKVVVGFSSTKTSVDKKTNWSLSLLWVGQAGDRFSYVYTGKSLVRDNGANGFNELMYVPTMEEVKQMQWVPFHNGTRPIGIAEQAEAMEQWIQTQPYLMQTRGNFAMRNGAQMMFHWQCDLKLEWQQNFHWVAQQGRITLSLECFNLAALLSRGAGSKFMLPDNRFQGITFLGFRDETSLTPLFRCDPDQLFRDQMTEIGGFQSGRLSRWLLQTGIKVTLY